MTLARRQLIRPQNTRRHLIRNAPTPDAGGGMYFASEKTNIRFIRSGCALLDCALGGGWPLGRVVNIVGDKSTGKTLLAMEAIANFFRQYPNGEAWYNEAESAFDSAYAEALGIPFDRVNFIEDCATVEELYASVAKIIEAAKKKDIPRLYIMDSLDALSDAAEKARDIDEASYGGAKAKKMSEFFRRATQDMKQTSICLMIISQVRDNIGAGMFGKKYTRSGGKALDFYCSQVVWLAFLGAINKQVDKVKRDVGVKIKAKCEKNKVSLPFREAHFHVTFGYGIEDEAASLAWMNEIGASVPKGCVGEELRALVVANWYRIEKSFLPTKGKYEE